MHMRVSLKQHLRRHAVAPVRIVVPIVAARVIAGRYRLMSQLGRGGMGVVWQARGEPARRRRHAQRAWGFRRRWAQSPGSR
ncbi:hypothetical protein DMB66_30345 [Actinoplanes sp. ATCC 53533]|nr:hypothetical protein DMB66_30345 [Actinoplanes sp. ATCC 53533]